MIWNKNKECMSRDEMSALQGKRPNAEYFSLYST